MQRQAGLPLTVEPEIGVGNGRRRGYGGDLSDTDGAAGHLQTGFVHHNRLNFRQFVGTEKAEGTVLVNGLA